MISVGPKLVKARKFKAAIMVQKFIKGYLGNKKAIRQLMESKVEETALYFKKIADHRLLGAVLKCQFLIKKALKRIRKRKDQEALMSKKKRVQAPIVDVKNKSKLAPHMAEIKKQTSNGVTFITQDKIV